MTNSDDRVIAALLANPTQKAAANAAGVHPNTITRLLQRDDFQRKLIGARQDMLASTLDRLQSISGQAIKTLAAVMGSPKSPASAKVAAARVTLEVGLRIIETVDILQRLASIEGRLNGNDGAN